MYSILVKSNRTNSFNLKLQLLSSVLRRWCSTPCGSWQTAPQLPHRRSPEQILCRYYRYRRYLPPTYRYMQRYCRLIRRTSRSPLYFLTKIFFEQIQQLYARHNDDFLRGPPSLSKYSILCLYIDWNYWNPLTPQH